MVRPLGMKIPGAGGRKHIAVGKGTMPESWRKRIQTTKLIQRAEAIAFGEVEAQPHQVTACLGLLKKTLPDLTENKTEHSGNIVVQGVRYTDPNS